MFAFVISGFLLFFKCMLEERGQEKENEREREKERACFLGSRRGHRVTLPSRAQPDLICKAPLDSLSLSSINGYLKLAG